MASEIAITKVLIVLRAAYPRYEIREETAGVYAELLHDLPDDILIAAAQHHAATSKWFPSVAELRTAATDIQSRALGVRSAEEAWINVQKAVRQFGYYGETVAPADGGGWRVPSMLSDLEKSAVDALGGWRTLCQSDNAVADRAHFLKIYGNLLTRETDTARMLPQVQQMISALADKMRQPELPVGERPRYD